METQSFWDHGIGKFLRSLFVIAIVWVPIYFASEAFGEKGFIGCIVGEFVLLFVVAKLFQLYKERKERKDYVESSNNNQIVEIVQTINPTITERFANIQYIDLGLTSGTLWADRNADAEGVYKLGTLYDKANAPGKLPTYDQCAELINECDFASVLMPDENNIMKNFIKVEGPNKNSIFFPCVHADAEDSEIGAYCWCEKDMDEYSYFMLFQERLLGILDFAEITNLTIGVTQASGKLMVRNVK